MADVNKDVVYGLELELREFDRVIPPKKSKWRKLKRFMSEATCCLLETVTTLCCCTGYSERSCLDIESSVFYESSESLKSIQYLDDDWMKEDMESKGMSSDESNEATRSSIQDNDWIKEDVADLSSDESDNDWIKEDVRDLSSNVSSEATLVNFLYENVIEKDFGDMSSDVSSEATIVPKFRIEMGMKNFIYSLTDKTFLAETEYNSSDDESMDTPILAINNLDPGCYEKRLIDLKTILSIIKPVNM